MKTSSTDSHNFSPPFVKKAMDQSSSHKSVVSPHPPQKTYIYNPTNNTVVVTDPTSYEGPTTRRGEPSSQKGESSQERPAATTEDDLHPSSTPIPLLIRATNGKSKEQRSKKIKLSTVVQPDQLDSFFTRYADICKNGMTTLKKRDRRKEKEKAKKRAKAKNKNKSRIKENGGTEGVVAATEKSVDVPAVKKKS
ncbi:MAG: hypothetical protein M1823_002931 [Watsoniomyces obsoletus]|nr:MAG: hypothetical protein M1823_002931 [Watsoniomyces obsoletus]